MAKDNWQGGQITTYIEPNTKRTKFSVMSVAFFIFCATAAGAFGVESIIGSTGPGLGLVILIVIPILWALPMGLYTSELTNLVPADSGPYVWAKMAFGEFGGFAFGFWLAVAWYLTGASYVVLAIDYLGALVSLTPLVAFIIKAAIIIVFTVVNLLGLEGVDVLDTIFTFIILATFLFVTIIGFCHWQYNPFDPFIPEGSGFVSTAGAGIAIGVWMYCGYVAIANLGGSIEDPRVIPKGMKLAILIIAISFILPTLAGIVSVGHWEEWGTTIDFSTVLTKYVGGWAGVVFVAVAVISNCALFNATTACAARSFVVLGRDNLCPKFLTKTTEKKNVPLWPILILCALNLVLVNLDFEVLVIILSPLLFVCYVAAAIAWLKIRKSHPVEKRGDLYYIGGGTAGKIYIVGGMGLVGIIGLFMNGTEYFLLGYVLIIAAFIMYLVCKKIYGGCAVLEPEMYPLNQKTKLGKGDIGAFGTFFIIFGCLAIAGWLFLSYYEGSWGPDYFKEVYVSGFLSDWYAMNRTTMWIGFIMTPVGIILKLVGRKLDPKPID
ncbi:MAG: APC family permease [Clostridia bacterium]|nr:APC family permease [Clostridia bacterium]